MIRAALIALFALALAVSACGKKGDPVPPQAEQNHDEEKD